ncbi:MAG: M28 family peptidase [Asgard group archaeon]|nr:M28 family peptidase [Asgard group archaeon]
MKYEDLINKVSLENLYRHLISIEGIRHPIDYPEGLDYTANYILNEFKKYGLKTNEDTFMLEGSNAVFRNIEGTQGSEKEKQLLISCHYDTDSISPGANDNGSGIAGMLEIARVLANNKTDMNIKFIAFILEEEHPVLQIKLRELLWNSGLVDDHFNFYSYHTLNVLNEFDALREKGIQQGLTLAQAWKSAQKQLTTKLTDKEKNYLNKLWELHKHITRLNWIGESICVGSTQWVKNNIAKKEKILGLLNLEEIGYISNKKNSQDYPAGIEPLEYEGYRINKDEHIGNFIGIFADKNSKFLADRFCASCKLSAIDLPYHNIQVSQNYDEIAQNTIDLLRSDHAPFWRARIPAISITDTFEFRYPFYHSSADTIEHINFNFVKKVVQATLVTILEII